MKLRKTLSLVLSLMMLLSMLTATGITLAGAEATYTVVDITDGVNEDKIIAANDNILNGATVTTVNASTAHPAIVTDGLLANVTVDYSNSTCWAPGSSDPYVMYVTYDLGSDYAVDSLLYAGSGVSTSSANDKYGPRGAKIYVGDKTGAEIKADASVAEPVYSTGDFVLYGRRIDLKEAVVGRYVVFAINCKADNLGGGSKGQVWISELAAAGTEVVPSYTVTDITDGVNEDKIIDPADNILKNAKATVTSQTSGAVLSDKASALYDGKLCGVTDGCAWGTTTGWDPYGKPLYITYDLGTGSEVTSILFAGSGLAGYGITATSIYVGDKPGAEAAADEPVYTTADLIIFGRRIDLAEPVVGRYIVLVLTGKAGSGSNGGQMWISELAATGTTDEPVKPPKTEKYNIVTIGDSITQGMYFDDPDGDGHANTMVLDKTYSVQLEALLDAASDTVDYTVKNHGLSGTTVVAGSLYGSSRAAWYDSKWSAASADVATADAVTIMLGTNDCEGWANGANKLFKQEYKKLVAAIREANPDVDIYLLTSPAAYVSTHYNVLAKEIVPMQLELAAELGLKVVDIYNVTRDLMRDGNASGEKGQAALMTYFEANGYCQVHPDEEGASYIAKAMFDALANENNVHVSELKYSATADTDGNLTGIGDGNASTIAPDANRVTPLGHNLLVATGVTYRGYNLEGGKCYLTDGILRYVNKATGTNHNASCDEIIVDFGTAATISQFLLGGTQVSGTAAATFLYPGAKFYVTDDLDNLGDAVCTLTDTADDATVAGHVITLTKPVTGRYMVVKVDMKTTSDTTNAWLSEIAAVGYRAEQKALGGQVRGEDANGNTALRFGFDLVAEGVAYVDADPVANNNYKRDLTNATIAVGGVDYKLVDFGAVLSLDKNSALTLDAANADATGATKVVPAQNLYNVDGVVTTYTAVVTNIPATALDTPIYARSYVTYSDGTNEYTVYGDVISRTVNNSVENIVE